MSCERPNETCDFALATDDSLVIRNATPCRSVAPEGLIGKLFTDAISPVDRGRVTKHLHAVRDDSGTGTCAAQLSLRSELCQWYRIEMQYASSSTQQPWVLCCTGMNSGRQQQQALRNVDEHMMRVARLRLLGQIGASFAHDLSQPLQVILAYGDMMQARIRNGSSDTDNMLESIDHILESVAKAGEIVKQFRNFARFREVEEDSVPAGLLMDRAVKMASEKKGVAAETIEWSSQQQGHEVLVQADPTHIIHVMLNLLMNALEAVHGCRADRPSVVIGIQQSPQSGFVQFSIADNGTGLPSGDPEQVFEQFYSTKEEGLGLGLAASRDIIESHGGRMWVQNNVDRGCTFFFTLRTANGAG
jgi:C4-dicarboxylate-specific signal transduction histidine kinase